MGFAVGAVVLAGWVWSVAGSDEHAMSTTATITATTAMSLMVSSTDRLTGVYRAGERTPTQKRQELSHETLESAMT